MVVCSDSLFLTSHSSNGITSPNFRIIPYSIAQFDCTIMSYHSPKVVLSRIDMVLHNIALDMKESCVISLRTQFSTLQEGSLKITTTGCIHERKRVNRILILLVYIQRNLKDECLATIGGSRYILKTNPHFSTKCVFSNTLASVGKLLGVSRLSLGLVATPTGKYRIFSIKMLLSFQFYYVIK